MRKIGIVIPTYNERDNITVLLDAVHEVLPDATILVVDDSSPDGTGEIVEEYGNTHPWVSLLVRQKKEGLGLAYFAGFNEILSTNVDAVVQMDADFSHRPCDLSALVAAVEEGADLALGSRYIPGGSTDNWGIIRKMTSRGGSLYASLMLGLKLRDVTGGFRCWSAELLRRAISTPLYLQQFGFQIEMAYRASLLRAHIREVPILFPDRERGTSKMSRRIFVEALFGVLGLRLHKRELLRKLVAGIRRVEQERP